VPTRAVCSRFFWGLLSHIRTLRTAILRLVATLFVAVVCLEARRVPEVNRTRARGESIGGSCGASSFFRVRLR
jgi:hypothetical protein